MISKPLNYLTFIFTLIGILFISGTVCSSTLFVGDFETGGIQSPSAWHDGWSIYCCPDYVGFGYRIVCKGDGNITRAGNYALHAQLVEDSGNCWPPDYRARMQLNKEQPSAEVNFDIGEGQWLGYSMYIPNDWPTGIGDGGECLVMEITTNIIHTLSNEALGYEGNETIVVRCDPAGEAPWDVTTYVYNKPIVKGEWVDWVIYYKPAYDNTGVFKLWRNGVYASPTAQMINECNAVGGSGTWRIVSSPKLYKYNWKTDPQPYSYLHAYFDEFRMIEGADNTTNFALVDPAQGGPGLPTITSQAVTDITDTTAIGHGTITATGGENATKRGICWRDTTGSPGPTVADNTVEEVGNFFIGVFSGNMTGLAPGQHYYAKPYGYNTAGYAYGDQVEFDSNSSATYILDNGDAGTSYTGTWNLSGGANPYGTNSVYADTDATYSFQKTIDGNYTVSVWWTVAGTNRDENATIEIYDGSGGDNLLDTKHVNQKLSGGQWNEQDTYDFNATAKVVIVSTADSPVVATSADAVKFDYVEGSGGEDINDPSRLFGVHLQGCSFQ